MRLAHHPRKQLATSMGASHFGRHRGTRKLRMRTPRRLQWGPPISGGIGEHADRRLDDRRNTSMGASHFGRHRWRPAGQRTYHAAILQWGPPISGGIGGEGCRHWSRSDRTSMGASHFGRHRGGDARHFAADSVRLQWGPPISGGIGPTRPPGRHRSATWHFNGGLPFREASDRRRRARRGIHPDSMGASHFGRHRGSLRNGRSSWAASYFNGGLPFREASAGWPVRHLVGGRNTSMGASHFGRHRLNDALLASLADLATLQWGPPISGGIGRVGTHAGSLSVRHFNGGLPFREASGNGTQTWTCARCGLQWGPPISGGIGWDL